MKPHDDQVPMASQQVGGLGLWESIHTPILSPKDTRREAHESIGEHATRLETMALDSLRADGPATSDQVATRLGIDRLSIRPRMTMLRDLGRIRDSGIRRPNVSGKLAAVWEVSP